MRILVSGAAGFIGWNLTRELRKRHPDAEIIGVDNLWTGVRRREEFVDRMIELDIERLAPFGEMDHIYHLASPASPSRYQSSPLRTIRANVDGLWSCLNHMGKNSTLFFASSSEVYGDPIVSPQPESYKGQVSCTGVRACYDESKRLCETILCDWHRTGRPGEVKIARLFNVYGPGTLPDDGRCMSNFIWDAMHGRSVTIYGDGLQTRCFTYVDNVVQAIAKLVEDTEPAFVGPVNIGTNVESTVRDIAVAVMAECAVWRQARGMTRILAPVEYLPPAADDPRQRLPDLALAEKILGWKPGRLIPHWGATGGIARTIKYFANEWWDEDEADSDEPQAAPVQAAGDHVEPAGVAGGPDRAVGADEPG